MAKCMILLIGFMASIGTWVLSSQLTQSKPVPTQCEPSPENIANGIANHWDLLDHQFARLSKGMSPARVVAIMGVGHVWENSMSWSADPPEPCGGMYLSCVATFKNGHVIQLDRTFGCVIRSPREADEPWSDPTPQQDPSTAD
jgi:hypothetical protein